MNVNFTITKKHVVISLIAIVIIVVLGLSIGIPFAVLNAPKHGKASLDTWAPSDVFDIEKDTVTLQKERDEEFKILNLTDIQISTMSDTVWSRDALWEMTARLVESEKPDLITLTGDNVWTSMTSTSITQLVEFMESLDTPWAPVLGNHEDDGNADLLWIGDRFEEAENSLYRKGPMLFGGTGNYIINIEEDGKSVHTMYMMYNGNDGKYADDQYLVDEAGKNYGTGIGAVSIGQIAWYEWAVEGIKLANKSSEYIQSSCYMHVPLPEFHIAYIAWEATWIKNSPNDTFNGEKAFGFNGEPVCCPRINSGFFDSLKEHGTKDVVVGHDHVNNSSIVHEGVRLTYTTKTGDRSYYVKDGSMNGGTRITINGAGEALTEHVYITY